MSVEIGIIAISVISVLSLGLSIFALRQEKGDDSSQRLSEIVQKLAAQVAEAHQQSNVEQAAVLAKVSRFQQELTAVQNQIADLAQIVLASAHEPREDADPAVRQAAAEKKTEQLEKFRAELEQSASQVIEVEQIPAPAPGKIAESVEALQRELEEIRTGADVRAGLTKTRASFLGRFKSLFASSGGKASPELFDELEELLITSDLGVKTTQKLLDRVRALKGASEDEVRNELRSAIEGILALESDPEILPVKREGQPLVVAVVGVNGAGKTTTIAKLAKQFKDRDAKVLIAACDTFRAAASDQLDVWAKRVGVEVVVGDEGAKPSTVAYQAVHRAQDEGYDVLIVDTAGRLHTRVNLMNELANVLSLVGREQPGAPHETILVVDATTGQNALQQAREFHAKSNLTGIVVTKIDGTPKGGIVVAIKEELGIPVRYVGVGESVDALKKFDAKEFVEGLFSDDAEPAGTASSGPAANGQARRRRREFERVDSPLA